MEETNENERKIEGKYREEGQIDHNSTKYQQAEYSSGRTAEPAEQRFESGPPSPLKQHKRSAMKLRSGVLPGGAGRRANQAVQLCGCATPERCGPFRRRWVTPALVVSISQDRER